MRSKSIRAWMIVLILSVVVLHASGSSLSGTSGGKVQIIYSNDVAGYIEPCG